MTLSYTMLNYFHNVYFPTTICILKYFILYMLPLYSFKLLSYVLICNNLFSVQQKCVKMTIMLFLYVWKEIFILEICFDVCSIIQKNERGPEVTHNYQVMLIVLPGVSLLRYSFPLSSCIALNAVYVTVILTLRRRSPLHSKHMCPLPPRCVHVDI